MMVSRGRSHINSIGPVFGDKVRLTNILDLIILEKKNDRQGD
jgi:hypothetical protein